MLKPCDTDASRSISVRVPNELLRQNCELVAAASIILLERCCFHVYNLVIEDPSQIIVHSSLTPLVSPCLLYATIASSPSRCPPQLPSLPTLHLSLLGLTPRASYGTQTRSKITTYAQDHWRRQQHIFVFGR